MLDQLKRVQEIPAAGLRALPDELSGPLLLRQAVAGERDPEVSVTGLNGSATVVVRARASGPIEAERLESDLRVRAQANLRAAGVFG